MNISSQLSKLRTLNAGFSNDSTISRSKKIFLNQVRKTEKYRIGVLKNISTFKGLTEDQLKQAAQSLLELIVDFDDVIITQGDIGDSFFIIEDGLVSIRRKNNLEDPNENPRELCQLGKNTYFGEMSLITKDFRSATAVCISSRAKLLQMTKTSFDALVVGCHALVSESRSAMCRNIIDKVPIFQMLSQANKSLIHESLTYVSFPPNTDICRQGEIGDAFYIIADGLCKVIVTTAIRPNTPSGIDKEVSRLRTGDYFGEVALIESSSRRTATVTSITDVTCMSLKRPPAKNKK